MLHFMLHPQNYQQQSQQHPVQQHYPLQFAPPAGMNLHAAVPSEVPPAVGELTFI